MPAAPEGQAILEARDVTVRYGPVTALEGMDLDVRAGEVVAIVGENGAGKSTFVRCVAGDVVPYRGRISVRGHPLAADPRAAARLGVAVVWQDLALCDNLDIASNLLLGRESRLGLFSATRFHGRAAALLDDFGIDLPSTDTPVSTLSGGQRQLVAVARAMRDRPALLILDEPTASLGVYESARVEELTASLPSQGTSVLVVTHDVEQMFRLADRIVILRKGKLVAELRPEDSHPDEVTALLAGQGVDLSARRQLSRLHTLADQLASAEPSSSLTLILSALGAALGIDQLCVHVAEDQTLRLAGSVGLPSGLAATLALVPAGPAGGQIGRAITSGHPVISRDVRVDPLWGRHRTPARLAGVASSWSIPFTGATGDRGVITLLDRKPGEPSRDHLELAGLYAGYASSALERDRLLGEATVRNRVLESIREVLQALAGPASLETSLEAALQALRSGLGAPTVGLVTRSSSGQVEARALTASTAKEHYEAPIREVALPFLDGLDADTHRVASVGSEAMGPCSVSAFPAPEGTAALVIVWGSDQPADSSDLDPLIEDAANSLRLALEREASERAQREAIALRGSQELQRRFLSWLSHELRTPLTAIRGYASSLMQTDVAWDGQSTQRFLERISDESARLGRLVDDLLDFSAIDAGILRLHPDWCDLGLVLAAARDCLPESAAARVQISCEPGATVIWADHDRLEQIFVNLLDNAIRHNPDGTTVRVSAMVAPPGHVTVTVTDDGTGLPPDRPRSRPATSVEHLGGIAAYGSDGRSRTRGAGLGLSIARGIAEAHGGRLEIRSLDRGTRCLVELPVAKGAPADTGSESEIERVTTR